MQFSKSYRNQHEAGFTLVEIMIVVAIVAIIAMIAYPSYTESVKRSKRAEMQSLLFEAAQWMERFYSENNCYDQTLSGQDINTLFQNSGLVTSPRGSSGANVNYNIAITLPAGLPARTYTLTATAVNSMLNDRCGNFSLTSAGVKSVSTSDSNCWSR